MTVTKWWQDAKVTDERSHWLDMLTRLGGNCREIRVAIITKPGNPKVESLHLNSDGGAGMAAILDRLLEST